MKRRQGALPGSKSDAQRAIVCAALAGGESVLRGVSSCSDVSYLLQAVQTLGTKVAWKRNVLEFRGGRLRPFECVFVGESGLAARLLAPVCALFDKPVRIEGGGSLRRRPMEPMVAALQALGASASGSTVPITVRGPLRGGVVEVDSTVSSQFLSGLLLALPLAASPSTVVARGLVSAPYIDMTLATAAAFGVHISREGDTFSIAPQSYRPADYTVEADWSAAAFLLVAGATCKGATLRGLNPLSLQPDRSVLEALRLAGAKVSTSPEAVAVEPGALHPFAFDCTHCPDLIPPLVALAAACDGVSELRGAARLPHKESDRGAALRDVFGQIGISVEIDGDTVRVQGGEIRGGVRVSSHGDHRIAMAAAVAGMRAAPRFPVRVERPEVVMKSFPAFFEALGELER